MRKYLRWLAGAAGILCLSILAGCGAVKFEPQESGIYINGDGSLSAAEIESFDNSTFGGENRYSEEELRAFVEEAVRSYNQEADGRALAYGEELEKDAEPLPITIVTLKVEENVAELVMNYAACEDYLAFNEADDTITGLSIQSAPVAAASGISLDGFTNAKGEAVDTSKARESEKYRVAAIQGNAATSVTVNGKILGVSGAVIKDDHVVLTSAGETSYILFR